MAANIGEMLTNISATLGRGTTFDDALIIRIRNAVRQIERDRDFHYMFSFNSAISLTTATRRLVVADLLTATDRGIKRVEFLRIVDSTSDFHYMEQVAPQDLSARTTTYSTATTGMPTSWWMDGDEEIVLNVQTASTETAEGGFYEYSNLGSSTSTATSWLFTNAEDLVEAQVMFTMAARIRDTEGMQRWKAMRDELHTSLEVSEADLTAGGGSLQMRFPGA